MQKPLWQRELIGAFFSVRDLLLFLEIDPRPFNKTINFSAPFAIRVPRSFAEKMEKGNINDPLLKQVLPYNIEHEEVAGFSIDPVGDLKSNTIEGLIHKYENRVLLTLTGNCAVHCRYCFRRHFPYIEQAFNKDRFSKILAYIKENKAIEEVILSGGDPLSLNDDSLAYILSELDQCKQLKTIRFHTRFPVVIPSRITTKLLNSVKSLGKNVVFVYHINHQNELCTNIKRGVKKLKNASVAVLNQTVLLKDINDSADELKQLSDSLFNHGILPYYLHLLDRVHGAAHFDVDEKSAVNIYTELKTKTSGYIVPTLVKEIEGEANKVAIGFDSKL